MKKYNFQQVKEFIKKNKDALKEVSVGMAEDWWWTAETVWDNGDFTQELNEDTVIGGINSSRWATPSMLVIDKDNEEKLYEVSTGESEQDREMPPVGLGPMSMKRQTSLPQLEQL